MAMSDGSNLLGFLIVANLVKHSVLFMWKNKKPWNAVFAGRVTELNLYPIKSAKPLGQTVIDCKPDKGAHNGELMDRHWMVVTSEGVMVTARQHPKLLGIQPRFENGKLVLTAEGHPNIIIDPEEVERTGKLIQTNIHGATAYGLDCGERVSKWLGTFISERGYRLLYSGRQTKKRNVVGDLALHKMWTSLANPEDKMVFQDELPFHLCSEKSVEDLNCRLVEQITVERFRPNITVSTKYPAYDEDTWRYVVIGDVRFRTIKLTERCVMPTIDHNKCVRNVNNEPSKTMNGYRRLIPGSTSPVFGISMIVEKPGRIRVGDEIHVVRGDNTTPATQY